MTIDAQRAGVLLQALMPEALTVKVERVMPLVGGLSADTFRVQATFETTDGARGLDVVVRRIPVDGLLAPYDVEREYRILLALQKSPVPVPAVIGCDPDGEHLGAPCLVTAYVDGEPLSFFGQATASDDPRLPAYYAALAAIHSLDWRALGLEFLDEADDPVEGELSRDEARLELHDCAGPEERRMLAWLRANKPPDMSTAFVHGDPNHANYLFAGSRVAAVVDWELAFVGDPRIDLGFFAAARTMFGGTWELSTRDFLRGYAAANPGANLQHLDYFEAVGLFRLTGFLHAAERLRGMEVAEGRRRLHERFDEIAAGKADLASLAASTDAGAG